MLSAEFTESFTARLTELRMSEQPVRVVNRAAWEP
jgi:hypothetical protein